MSLGYSVRYTTSAALLHDLTASLADHTLPQRIRYYARFDLLDHRRIRLRPHRTQQSPQAANLFFKIIDARSRQRSTALVTNIDFDAGPTTSAIRRWRWRFLDRIVDGAIILKINGKSYRAHRASSPNPPPTPNADHRHPLVHRPSADTPLQIHLAGQPPRAPFQAEVLDYFLGDADNAASMPNPS